jgi:tryptophan synthase beta chain
MPKNIFNCPLPDEKGYFGEYGGSFIPPELQTIMDEITASYLEIRQDPEFLAELTDLYQHYCRYLFKKRRPKPYRCT